MAYVANKLGDGDPFEIKIKKFSGAPDVIRGMVERSTHSAIIRVAADNNTCWTRFVVIKELMQLLVDTESTFIEDVVAQLDLVRTMVGMVGTNRTLNSEDFALFAAIEYSFQRGERPKPPIKSSLEIATRLLVPQVLIEAFYSPDWSTWSLYATGSEEFHREIDKLQ